MGSVLPDALTPAAGRKAALAHLDALVEAGCTAFDTAAIYQAGGTERLLGAWLARGGPALRARVQLVTKGVHPNPLLPGSSRFSARELTRDLEASLRRLKVERVEVYLMHRDDPRAPFEPLVEALGAWVRAGKVGAWGVSNWGPARLAAADAHARAAGLPPPAVSSPHFSLLDWVRVPWPGCVSLAGEAGAEARAFHARTGLPVLAWSPLGHGFLSDKLEAGKAPGDAALKDAVRTYGSEANWARKARCAEVARARGVSPAQVALAWLFHQPFPVSAVVAASTAGRMKSNLEAAALRLTASEVHYLETGARA
jgi:aryl-alcohol dehydrogenase-like predicted oxidoreductase